ncbi:MAG TPA: LamG domain-containing protein [Parafilimonas sp.]|nr:LamG domain-containing protein [Parafilimonas sp.]
MKKSTSLYLLLIAFLTSNFNCKKDSRVPTGVSSNEIVHVQTATLTLDSGLLCYLPFNSNLKDKSGQGNNGTLQGGNISYVADRFGIASRAISFSASNSWIEIPEADFAGLKTATIAMDFYPTTTGQQVLISKMSYSAAIGSPDFYQSFAIVFEATAQLGFEIRQKGLCNGTTGWNPVLYSNVAVILNTWNHIAITFNNTRQKMYLNGNLVSSGTKTASPICQGEPIRLGIWWQTDPEFYTGNMDEVRIYDRVLSQQEVKQLSKK